RAPADRRQAGGTRLRRLCEVLRARLAGASNRRHPGAVAAIDHREATDRCYGRLVGRGAEDMLIGVPKEIKTHEYRVGLIPGSVRELVHHGHKVVVESGAGAAIGFDDSAYEAAGAGILARAADVFAVAELIVKVKEPQPEEIRALREDQLLFTYV